MFNVALSLHRIKVNSHSASAFLVVWKNPLGIEQLKRTMMHIFHIGPNLGAGGYGRVVVIGVILRI
jgi:hypothetical protein